MVYDPKLAIKFAEEFWDRPCKSDSSEAALGLDGGRDVPLSRFWNSRVAPAGEFNKFEPRFVFNEDSGRDDLVALPKPGAKSKDGSALSPVTILDNKKEGEQLEDCAHFLSRCLIAGGLAIKDKWSVPTLLQALREREDDLPKPIGKTLAEKVSLPVAQSVIDAGLLRSGDMIGYFWDGGFQHSGMFTGFRDAQDKIGRITCHTKSRFMGKTPKGVPDEWHLGKGDIAFTLMRNGDNHPPALADRLSGWWKVENPHGTEFFFVQADGRAIRAAKKSKAPFQGVPDRGYWFSTDQEAQFCWRNDGRVDRLTPDAATVVIDGVGKVGATKLRD